MKATRGPAAAGPPRWALVAIAAAVLASGPAGCLGGDDSPDRPPGALAAALSYLPASSGVAIAVPTRLQAQQRRSALSELVRRLVAASGVRLQMVPAAQLGDPMALGLVRSGRLVGATRVRDGEAMRRQVQARIERGGAEGAGEHDGALLWRQGTGYGAVKGDDVVLGHSRDDVEQALEAGAGSDSMAFEDAVLKMLARLDDQAPARLAGDARRLLGDDPDQAELVRRVPWLRSLGYFDGVVHTATGGARIEFSLHSNRAALSEHDLPLEPGPRSPRLHDPGARASVALLAPDRLARFLEAVLGVTDPDAYSRYRSSVNQLRSFFGIDVHDDLLAKVTNLSVAFPSAVALTLEARIRPGQAEEVERVLGHAAPAFDIGIGDIVPGTSVETSGFGAGRHWRIQRGRLVLVRYAVRGGSIVASAGLSGLPRPTLGRRVRGSVGSLVFRGDARRLAELAKLVLPGPDRLLSLLSGLGKVSLSVRTEATGLTARGRLDLAARR
jgi:hypothetical protein